MNQPSIKIIKILFAKSGNQCAFPGCKDPIVEESGVVTGHICHIKARNSKGPRYDANLTEKEKFHYDNLVLLCSRHHQIIDKNPIEYSVEVLNDIKKIHEKYSGGVEMPEDGIFVKHLLNDYKSINLSNNAGNIIINSPNATQTNNLNIKSVKEKININILPPEGTISSDLKLLAYVEHLIKRYNTFASKDTMRKTKFSWGAIKNNIETNFGVPYKLVPIYRADELIIYLQKRIDKTTLSKINKGKGYKSYSTYEEFVKEYFKE